MENLLIISLSVSVVGVFLLLFLSNNVEFYEVDLGSIDEKMLNQRVRVHGTVLRVEDKGSFQVVSIVDGTGEIDVVCGSNISGVQEIQVDGTVSEYGGDLQISADMIIKK